MKRVTSTVQRLVALGIMGAIGAVAASSVGCNGILGIDERTLDETGAFGCQSYCADIQATCTGAFQEYQTPEACVATCEALELGTAEDSSGNTVGCRMRNVELARETGELGDYCPIAGPVGGGNCGDRCESFCTLFVSTCSSFSVIADQASCLSFCQSSPDNAAFDPQDLEARDYELSLQCRIWHLANAVLDPTLHCGHADGTTKCDGSIGAGSSSSSSGGSGGGGGDDAGSGGGGG